MQKKCWKEYHDNEIVFSRIESKHIQFVEMTKGIEIISNM